MKKAKSRPLYRLRRDRRAASPAISTAIITSAVVVMLLVTVSFANNYLNARLAENEFSAMKQYMQTVGLQIDDVAWIPGRTQTVRYASRNGQAQFQSLALNYSFYFDGATVANYSVKVGVVLFNMPISAYQIGNNYYERISPSTNSLLQTNASAPVCRVFVIEKVPMADGNYIRVVAAPLVRQLNAVINTTNYVRFYLPILETGPNPRYSQSVTLSGKNINHQIANGITNVTITVGFPNNGIGLGQDFFNFDRLSETVTVASSTVVEIYAGNVTVSMGLYA